MGAHDKPLDHHQNYKQQNPVYSNNRGQSFIIAPNAPEPLLRDDDGGGGGALQTYLSNPPHKYLYFNVFKKMYLMKMLKM